MTAQENNRFFQLVTMAEAGTLQSKQERIGGLITINPLYYREAALVGHMAVYSGIVSPLVLLDQISPSGFDVSDLVSEGAKAPLKTKIRQGLRAAVSAGLLKETNVNNGSCEDDPAFKLTKLGANHLVRRPVYVPWTTLEKPGYGCIITTPAIALGAVAGLAVGRSNLSALPFTTLGGAIGLGVAGSQTTQGLAKLVNARAAYKFSHQAS